MNCHLCAEGKLSRSDAPRFGRPAYIVGGILTVLGLVSLLGGLGTCGSASGPGGSSDISMALFASGVMNLLAAAVLMTRRLTWECGACGAVTERVQVDLPAAPIEPRAPREPYLRLPD